VVRPVSLGALSSQGLRGFSTIVMSVLSVGAALIHFFGFCCLFEWSVNTVLMSQSNQSALCVVTRVNVPIQLGEFIFYFVFFSYL
jgi:hypothetical protein